MPVHIYTPVQVAVPPHSEDHIRVVGGSNFDFSRFALVTPVIVVRNRKTSERTSDPRCRCFEVRFAPGAAALGEATKWRLLELPRDQRIWVAFGATSLARMRAQAVSVFLRAHGRECEFRRLYREGDGNDVLVLTSSQ